MTITDLLPVRSPSSAPAPVMSSRLRDADSGQTSKLRLNAHDLLTSLLGIRSRTRLARSPRASIRLSVYLPDGRSAVAIMLGADKA